MAAGAADEFERQIARGETGPLIRVRGLDPVWRAAEDAAVPARAILPMSSIPGWCIAEGCDHSKHAEADKGLVQPGMVVVLKAWPSKPTHPCLLRIPPTIAPHFSIEDVCVAMRSMNPQAQSIPASRFAVGGEWSTDLCDKDTPLIMFVRNTSDVPRVFSCSWECEDKPSAMTKYLAHYTTVLVNPRESAQITTRPQISVCKPRNLYIPPEIAQRFAINDVKVGNVSQTPQYGDIVASKFAHGSGAPYSCDPIQTAMDFVMVVTNTSDEPCEFVGVWACDFADPERKREPLRIGAMSDLDVERIASAVVRKMAPPAPPTTETMAGIVRDMQAAAERASGFGISNNREDYVSYPAPPTVGAPKGWPPIVAPEPAPRAPIHHVVSESEFPAGELARNIVGEASNTSRIDPASGKREPVPTRAERRDPPGFGWTPFDE